MSDGPYRVFPLYPANRATYDLSLAAAGIAARWVTLPGDGLPAARHRAALSVKCEDYCQRKRLADSGMMRAKRYVGSGRQDRKHGEEMVSKKVPSTQNSPSAAKRAAKATKQPAGNDTRSSDEERWRRTAIAAYYRAEARGFAPGGEIEDWLAAERDVDLESPADASASASAARSAEDPKRLVKPSGKSARKRTTPTRGSAPDARKQGDRS